MSAKKRKRGRPPGKRQRLRLWRDGKELIAEYWIKPDEAVIDVEFFTGWPTAAPMVEAQMTYPGERNREKP